MSTISETVGKRLRIRRTELGYSQELTSEKAGLHPTYIGQVERCLLYTSPSPRD